MPKASPRDQLDIIEATNRMCWHTDLGQWQELDEVFTDAVRVGYAGLIDREPEMLDRSELIAGWRATLSPLRTQHLLASHLVSIDGDRATCTAQLQAMRVGPEPEDSPWLLGGRYQFDLTRSGDGWRIAAMVLTTTWETGGSVVDPVPSAQS